MIRSRPDDEIGVRFQYLLGGYNETFAVSREALEDHFGLMPGGFSAKDKSPRDSRPLHAWMQVQRGRHILTWMRPRMPYAPGAGR
ncbi:hypothetical protein CBM2585_A10059 [Cupriavidus taiwanensis]|nr:hypothetical protein CBM2585_A10059 [Cupriavidus taiwanensis]